MAKLILVKGKRVVSIEGADVEVLRVAAETGLTVYDASYIVLARRLDAVLVTEDRKIEESPLP
jgi:hypothetical protein